MNRQISIQAIQTVMALAYMAIALVAFLRDPSAILFLCCIVGAIGFYLSGAETTGGFIDFSDLWRVAGVGILVAVVGIAGTIAGHQSWVVVVMSVCAGNRLKAAGVLKSNR